MASGGSRISLGRCVHFRTAPEVRETKPHAPAQLPMVADVSSNVAAAGPSDADMIDSAALLVRSSAVGQTWA